MKVGGLSLDGSIIELGFIACIVALLICAFLIGQYRLLNRSESENFSLNSLRRQVSDEEIKLDELRKQFAETSERVHKNEAVLEEWKEIRRQHNKLEEMRKQLDEFVREKEKLVRELELQEAEKSRILREIEAKLAEFHPDILSDDQTWNNLIAEREEQYQKLQLEIADCEKRISQAEIIRDAAERDVVRLEARKERVEEEINQARSLLDGIAKEQIDNLRPFNERLLNEAMELKEELGAKQDQLDRANQEIDRAATELNAKREAVEAVQNATIQFPDGAMSVAVKELPKAPAPKSEIDKLSAFRNLPGCLGGYVKEREETDEMELLNEFQSALERKRLWYPKEIICAFHTALKVNDLAPLTVMSGLSGTGKSQLPREYARFFGIHFLHVPVEPGWDSPQDILGFYDFVAERYRPTDRARALGHFDREFAQSIGIENVQNWSDRMLIILLDEMNLARTEYYFSEFLSRLEMRGSRERAGELNDRSDAQIAIDLPYGEGEQPKFLYVPHNVLWVGTLNEDETTQALSDKVLDRANSIRFAPPRPETLRNFFNVPNYDLEKADGFLPYGEWLKWSEPKYEIGSPSDQSDQIDENLENLARLMRKADRGFGYRIAQSIKAYIERYPGQDWRVPMIDQINMRLLPKLAGAELSVCQDSLNELKRMSEDTLGNPNFAQALEQAEQMSQTTQIFSWPGYTYESSS